MNSAQIQSLLLWAATRFFIPLGSKDSFDWTIVSVEDAHLGNFRWHLNGKGRKYVCHNFLGKLHRLIVGATSTQSVDHISRNTLDNRRENLRICSVSENLRNQARRPEIKSSRYKGVRYVGAGNRGKPWLARLGRNGSTYLGYFETEEQAAKAYNEASSIAYGQFARPNKIPNLN